METVIVESAATTRTLRGSLRKARMSPKVNLPIFRQGSAIERVQRDRFAELAALGTVSLQTVVFDNTLTRVGDVRAGRWETPLADAWHARAFF